MSLKNRIDEIITTRRLENVCKAFAIFSCRETAIDMALNRFDDDTKTAFRDFYAKLDDTIDTTVDTATLDPSTVMYLSTSYSQKDEVKNRGARWDENSRKCHVTAETVNLDPDFWNQFSPVAAETSPF